MTGGGGVFRVIISGMADEFWRGTRLAGLTLVAVALPLRGSAQEAVPGGRYVSPYGGVHEFGAWAGYSPVSGPLWGYDENVRSLTVDLRYSLLIRGGTKWNLRFAPEATVLANLIELAPSSTNPAAPTHTLGGGLNPEGFQLVFRPAKPVQPFISQAGGFLYYANRVLSPEGSRFMYDIDFGTGANFFFSHRTTAIVGFRYQHQSNANISHHNPGTDACLITLGFSHFHTSGVR